MNINPEICSDGVDLHRFLQFSKMNHDECFIWGSRIWRKVFKHGHLIFAFLPVICDNHLAYAVIIPVSLRKCSETSRCEGVCSC